MRAPVIHLNGTSPEYLLSTLGSAAEAVSAAIVAVNETAPNARDYYSQGSDAIGIASVEHASRMDRLREVLLEIQQITEAIMEQTQ